MPIDVVCSGCRQKLRANDSLAGKTVACPKCALKMAIPAAADDAAAFLLQDDAPPPAPSALVPPSRQATPPRQATPSKPARPAPPVEEAEDEVLRTSEEEAEAEPSESPEPKKKSGAKTSGLNKKLGQNKKRALKGAIVSNEAPFWLRNLHWVLVLTLIPLSISLLQPRSREFDDRLESTLEKATPEQRARAVKGLKELSEDAGGVEKLFAVLPNNRLEGAFLARDSKLQWAFALGSIVLFLGFFAVLSMTGSANPLHMLLVGLLTATVGIFLLLGFQWLADWTQFVWVRGRGILTLLFYIVKGIGYSYRMALDPESEFFPSFLGFTFGVGLCEELVKLLPVMVKVREDDKFTWHGAFLWGLASGAGFGIAEGIMYSANYYNGIAGWDIYAVRFISCVALHALWTGTAAIMLYLLRNMFHALDNWYDIFFPLLLVLGIPMVLHGLYDTMLKKNMEMGALVVAVLSFVFLAVQNTWLHNEDTRDANEEMLSAYKKQRA